jgi:hypothetical protein
VAGSGREVPARANPPVPFGFHRIQGDFAPDGAQDRELLAELYAELSFETGIRAGMWRQRPSAELIDGLIERALELAEPGSRAEAKALLALCHWNPEAAGDAAAPAPA